MSKSCFKEYWVVANKVYLVIKNQFNHLNTLSSYLHFYLGKAYSGIKYSWQNKSQTKKTRLQLREYDCC